MSLEISEELQVINEEIEVEASPGPRPLSRGSISPSRKTISRSGSGRSNLSVHPPAETGHHLDANQDEDDNGGLSDNGYDTDIEIENNKEEYDTTGRSAYVAACKKHGVTPVSFFIRHMQDSSISLSHHGLGSAGTRAAAVPLVTNTKLLEVDLTDNWMGDVGGIAIANMLKENCYISTLNLSENHLGLNAIEALCKTLQEYNTTVQHLNLSKNNLDEKSAVPISNLLVSTQKLESLNLSNNNFDATSGESLGFGISENTSLKYIDLSWNHFRNKGAVNIVKGIGSNIFLKKVDLSMNGLAEEGAKALKDALEVNNVLEEINISNNRIKLKSAVTIAQAMLTNETLRVLDIGDNPIQTYGCYGFLAALENNPSSVMENIHFTNCLVNQDFLDKEQELKEILPNLTCHYTDAERIKMPPKKVDPMEKVLMYVKDNGIRLVDFFNEFDVNHNLKITREEFILGLNNSGINLEEEEVESLIKKLDKDGDDMVNYSELIKDQQ